MAVEDKQLYVHGGLRQKLSHALTYLSTIIVTFIEVKVHKSQRPKWPELIPVSLA